MITPDEFPYIKSLHVNNCYTYKDFDINLHDYKPFSHLILTGKNGSGKSTILRAINRKFFPIKVDSSLLPTLSVTTTRKIEDENEIVVIESEPIHGLPTSQIEISFSILHVINKGNTGVRPMEPDELLRHYVRIYSYFPAKRNSEFENVDSPSKNTEFSSRINSSESTEFFIRKFKQYLVNQKIEQVFSQIENKDTQFERIRNFFVEIEDAFQQLFNDDSLEIEFNRNNYEFFLKMSDGRKLTFDVLSEGFSALLSILMDLFVRVDLIRKQVNNYTYNPCGIVLIDEPETHLHLQLQEQVLPLLTSLFPNIQFIAATHSPAVIASIKNATIFDLTTKESRGSEDTVGRSYSDLMRSHFGLNNEYSTIADGIFKHFDQILHQYRDQPEELRKKLHDFFTENEAYLSPTLRIELESMILENA